MNTSRRSFLKSAAATLFMGPWLLREALKPSAAPEQVLIGGARAAGREGYRVAPGENVPNGAILFLRQDGTVTARVPTAAGDTVHPVGIMLNGQMVQKGTVILDG